MPLLTAAGCVVTRTVLLMFLSFPAILHAASESDSEIRQIWQVLDYVAVDYAGAVSNGAVLSESEYREMVEFVTTAQRRLEGLPATTAPQRNDVRKLVDLVQSKASSIEVARSARALAGGLLATYGIAMGPKAIPDRMQGSVLFLSECSICHGVTGHGDGPAGATLNPRPIDFTDRTRASERSLFALYQAVTQGVPGTAMKAFPQLSDEQRWSLAFMVGGFSYSDAEADKGEREWKRNAALRGSIKNLDAIAGASELGLVTVTGADFAGPVAAFLRLRPESVLTAPPSGEGLDSARRLLADSHGAYARGDLSQARKLALAAYLDGFEPVEPALAARNRALLNEVETAMSRYRALLENGAPEPDVATKAAALEQLLARVDLELGGAETSATAAFIASFTILVREGLEALLIIIAMLAFLAKSERKDALVYVHAGWIGALLAGIVTWAIATYAVRLSGASRELTEGLSSLFAAIVLIAVGIWMHQKSLAGRWQDFVRAQLSAALGKKSAWFLFTLAFITVYREVFETILFYIALWNANSGSALLWGLVAGIAVLALIAFVLLRFSKRLPIGKFFRWSSWLIAVLAVVLAGKGVAALQEAGWVGIHPLGTPRIEVLGIFPSLQPLLAQAAVIVSIILGFVVMRKSSDTQVPSK